MWPSSPSAPSYSYDDESNWSSTVLYFMTGMAIGALYWIIPYACLPILEYLVNPTTDPDPDPPVLASNPNPNPNANPQVLASNVVPDPPVASNRIPPFVVVRTYQHDLERGGLDPATISSYPRFPYSPSRGGDDDVCSICLSEYSEGEMLRMMPCMHSFHLLCVDEWLRLKASCPLCRTS